jgi:hypothetical protein
MPPAVAQSTRDNFSAARLWRDTTFSRKPALAFAHQNDSDYCGACGAVSAFSANRLQLTEPTNVFNREIVRLRLIDSTQ